MVGAKQFFLWLRPILVRKPIKFAAQDYKSGGESGIFTY